jgi:dTDP-4-amino-4,6-dideoxygalactose transaminase
MNIPFNVPYLTGNEAKYIDEAMRYKHLSGDGIFTKRCEAWLEATVACKRALLVPSCTAALEMAAILSDIQPGDEVILPSYTFVSTANAFVLRGAIPIFVDVRADTMNIDEQKIAAAITVKTKAIVVVHYAGVACEMDTIMQIAAAHKLLVIEDAAQALMASYKQRPLGSIGHLSTFSFHATKNINCGEGGALCINDDRFITRAEIIREKGTNRKQFFEGQVDKYTWVDIGSSYLLNEISAACLYAQFEQAEKITQQRLAVWERYYAELSVLDTNIIRSASIPLECQHNAHLYFFILASHELKIKVMEFCKQNSIGTATHYIPLHQTAAGRKFGRVSENLSVTDSLSVRLLRLPLWPGVELHQDKIIENIRVVLNSYATTATLMAEI